MKKLALTLCIGLGAFAQNVVYLWPGGAPGSEAHRGEAEKTTGTGDFVRVTNIHNPNLTVYLPKKGNGTGIVIFPGGGHRHLAIEHEGSHVAKRLNEMGVAAFVVKYRLARAEGSTYKVEEHALADAQRALLVVKHHAKDWGVDPNRVGVMGFSAGGEVAALAASRFHEEQGLSSRPAFQVLMYPGGKLEAIQYGKDAPPAFLLMANDDPTPTVRVTPLYESLKKQGVPAELHIYEKGGHGFGVKPGEQSLVGRVWMSRLEDWMRDRGLLN